jgi:predicted RNA-binding Zn-ribbon protein involved in translation (DUF1610 family)
MLETRCEVCRTYLDGEDLFCSNCGTENPSGLDSQGIAREVESSTQQIASVLSFQCDQCGASMSYDASAKQLRCPFCGSEKLHSRPNARTLKPRSVVPFRVNRDHVDGLLREWLGKGFWRPNDASEQSVISKATPVYVPFWVFSAEAETAWTADTSRVPIGARGTWRPISGTTHRSYRGVLVGASGTLTPMEIREIAPFDLSESVDPESLDLLNVVVEEFRVTRRDARAIAKGTIDQIVAEEVRQQIDGSIRNLRVNVRTQDMSSVPVLLPVWIMVYRYKEKSFRVLVNGQTSEVYGIAPFSNTKLMFVIAGVFALVLLIIAFVVFASLASHHL